MKLTARTFVLLFHVGLGVYYGVKDKPSSSFGETFVFMAVASSFALIVRYGLPVCSLLPKFREYNGPLIMPTFSGPIFNYANPLQRTYDVSIVFLTLGVSALVTAGVFHFALSFVGFATLVIGLASLLGLESFVSQRQINSGKADI